MGLAEALIFRGWPRPERPERLVLDLTRPSLCGIQLGAPAHRVRELLGAPASWREKRRGCWAYPRWGLRLDVPADREVSSFCIALGQPERGLTASRLPWQSFAGQLVLPGQNVSSSGVTRADFERAFSKPDETEELLGDTLLTWRRQGWLLEVAFHPEAGPLYVDVEQGE
ncbi:hypothetical protein [Hyalangium gracile]|uniref:hypothetical protein n=1 Tax=Hyalangium gracile TaxID=394092 RepID=UPI001CCD5873|nr:hypothetical protein [Hyalangium gracile]